MGQLLADRRRDPGRWLAAAVVFDLLGHASLSRHEPPVAGWILLDLLLAYRITKGGYAALALFRVVETTAFAIYGLTLVAGWTSAAEVTVTPALVALYGASVWCLTAPALTRHVTRAPAFGPVTPVP